VRTMVIVKKGDCEHCGRFYRYSLWDCGFGGNSYAYCDKCGMLGILNYSNPQVAGFPPLSQQYAEIDASWEELLGPCVCGGHFRRGAAPRCPDCLEQLSPVHAAKHIATQTTAAAKGWQWQNNWSGVYCMAMDDPNAPGNPRQMIDPILKPDIAKTRTRWARMLSFGR
jgi:hypothetical protein